MIGRQRDRLGRTQRGELRGCKRGELAGRERLKLLSGQSADGRWGDCGDLRRRVLAASPNDTGMQLELCHVINYNGFALASSNDVTDAKPLAKEAFDMSTALIGIDPNNARWQREHVESLQ